MVPTGQPTDYEQTHVPGTIRNLTSPPARSPHIGHPPIGISHAQAGIRDSRQNTFAADCGGERVWSVTSSATRVINPASR